MVGSRCACWKVRVIVSVIWPALWNSTSINVCISSIFLYAGRNLKITTQINTAWPNFMTHEWPSSWIMWQENGKRDLAIEHLTKYRPNKSIKCELKVPSHAWCSFNRIEEFSTAPESWHCWLAGWMWDLFLHSITKHINFKHSKSSPMSHQGGKGTLCVPMSLNWWKGQQAKLKTRVTARKCFLAQTELKILNQNQD